ncbi:MAG TPA: thrombospondin type 3 repeat-containing protein, partial [Polyangia bacterium]|nr:thrombospondin type 3 repeat-containing protein [Polyangia bacterium]
MALAGPARAQLIAPHETTIDTQLWQPAIGPRNYLTIENTSVAEHKLLSFGLSTNYQRHPFILYTNGNTTTATNLVDYQWSTELQAAMGLFGRYQAGIALPFTLYLAGDRVDEMGAPLNIRHTESGIGDVRIEGKALIATLGEDEEYTVAVSGGLSLPTGKSDSRPYLGDKNVTGRIKAIGAAELGKVRAAANLGILLRGTTENFKTQLGPQLLYGAAAAYPVDRKVDVIVELFGRSGLNDFAKFYSDVNPWEVDIAGRYQVNGMWSVTAGGGRGFGNGIGAPDLRLFAMAAFAPDFRDRDKDGIFDVNDKCPDDPEDRDGFQDQDGCPDPDNDFDTIPDAKDRCPNEAEDVDQFEDEDGCPEPDNDKDGVPDINDACPNAAEDGKGKKPHDGCPSTTEDGDGDGVPDATDKCPDEPEDRDGFEDDDGCLDPDNDADGIPDNFDNCPNQAEDPDGFEDEDGCPDPDNDKDGFLDAVDKCPLQAETLNANKDDDGCPDPGAELARLGRDRIELDEKIGFVSHGGKLQIKEGSTKYVNLVALIMKGHTEIPKIRIEVHAEGVPQTETQKRAEAVRDFLVGKGVDTARLVPVGAGAGPSKVEFLIDTSAAKPAAPAAFASGAVPAPGAVPAAVPAPVILPT